MTQDRLSELELLSKGTAREVNFDEMIDAFVATKARKKQF